MPVAILARRIALLIFAALYPVLAFGLDQTYEGMLLPDNRDPPIPIVVELREVGGLLTGRVTTSPPLRGNAPIESGGNASGNCSVNVVLSRTAKLLLRGRCEQTTFQGTYTIFDAQRRTESTGRFRLAHKATEAVKPDNSPGTAPSTGTMAACLKANTQCLTACPRGDEGAELMCSSRCRTKFRACKGRVTKLPSDAG